MSESVAHRGNWSSKFGFILAAAGSAIGLGNIWRFPYTAGESGGAAFILVYLGFVLLIGVPVILAELSIGRRTERNPVGAFKALVPGKFWPVVGGLGVLTGFGILSFYTVVAGWTLGYLYQALTGAFGHELTAEESNVIFGQLVANPLLAIALGGVFLLLTAAVVQGGISGGIERAAKILMPIFFVLLVVLAVRCATLEGAREGLEFMFKPDFSKLSVQAVANALGQALFSLSLGMGAMITFGSYLPKDENLHFSGVSVALFDTLIAILGGLIIFPALFHAGADPQAGPGLVFVVMPTIFHTLPAGTLFSIAFYALLAIAALTSTISLLEVIVAYFVDERGWHRSTASWGLAAFCFALSIPSALSVGANGFLSSLAGRGFLDLMSIVFGNYALSTGAFLICVFVGWKWGVKNALEEIQGGGHVLPAAGFWSFLIRYLCPAAVLVVLSYIVITGNYF